MDPERYKQYRERYSARDFEDASEFLREYMKAEPELPSKPAQVYYLRFCCRVKIGYTTNLDERRKVIPHHELLATEPGGREVERERHEEFEPLRDVGEWFEYGPALQAHILRLQGRAPMLADTEAAALYAGVGIETIYRWANEGRLTRYGGRGKGGARWDVRQIPQWGGPESGKPRPGPPKKLPKNFQDRG
jgi:hypothetical protein